MAAEIIPGYFIHTPDEKFGPYANIMEADTAAEKLMSEGVQVLGITKEGFEGVVSYEALEYSAESLADRMPFPPSVPSAGIRAAVASEGDSISTIPKPVGSFVVRVLTISAAATLP